MLLKRILNLTSSLCVVAFFFFSYVEKQWNSCVSLEKISFVVIQDFSSFVRFCFLISNDYRIFRLWCCCSVDKILEFFQLNFPWLFRQCPVAPELSDFPLRLSCWCSMVLVMTFLLVLPIYLVFQVQSNFTNNWKAIRKEFLTYSYISGFLKSNSHLLKKFVLFASKMMKNAFHFTLKALFVLQIFKCLFWRFGYIEKTACF